MLNAESSFTDKLHEEVEEVNLYRYEMDTINRRYSLLRGTFRDFFDMGLIFLLVYLIIKGELAIANVLVIHNYAGRVPNIVYSIGILLDSVKDFNLSSSRVFDIMYSSEFRKEKFGTKHLDKVHGDF